jgi:molecular chaperone DnaK
VLATDGDPFLGGADFDDRLTEYVLLTLERKSGQPLRTDPVAEQRVRLASEQAKRDLSENESTQINLPHLLGANGSASLVIERSLLRSLTEDLAQRTLIIVDRVLQTARVTSAQLDDVILVGGQSRSPMIRELVRQRLGREPTRNVHPDHAVAIGAARVGAALDAQAPLELTDVLPSSLRLVHSSGSSEVILPRGAPLPADKELTVSSEIHPDGPRFRIVLCSGESPKGSDNTPLGEVQLPSNLALAFAKTPAKVTIAVSADGLLHVTARHPMTGEVRELRVGLADHPDEGDILEVDDSDLVAL